MSADLNGVQLQLTALLEAQQDLRQLILNLPAVLRADPGTPHFPGDSLPAYPSDVDQFVLDKVDDSNAETDIMCRTATDASCFCMDQKPRADQSKHIQPPRVYIHKTAGLNTAATLGAARILARMSLKTDDETKVSWLAAVLMRFVPMKPDSRLQTCVDIACSVLIGIDAVLLPYLIGLRRPLQGPLLYFTLCTTSFWVLEMLKCFFTGYYAIPGSETMPPLAACAKRYVQTWAIPDLLSIAVTLALSCWIKLTTATSLPQPSCDS